MFDNNGVNIYTPNTSTKAAPDVPFTVKVSISDLNIRKGPGTDYAKTGKFTGKGVFTIVEVQSGQGASAGWGTAEVRRRLDFSGLCSKNRIRKQENPCAIGSLWSAAHGSFFIR